ncbi:MAG TPA: cytochrome P450 [Gemmataceae bacterium]|nr:cytochrome P450 [Gemmataceae bacterium]
MTAPAAPPGPRGRWLTGTLAEFSRDRLGFMARCARDYGDVVATRLGPYPVWFLFRPDLIEEVLVNQARNFTKHFALRLNPLVLGNGLLTSEGDFWLRQRRLIQPAFNRQRLAGYAPAMVAAARRMLDRWAPGAAIDVPAEMMRLTLEIAAETMFGARVGPEADTVADALRVLQQSFVNRFGRLVRLPVWVPTPRNVRLRRAVARLDEIIYRFIGARRRSGADRGDVLSLLLHARDEDDGTGMTDKQLRDEAMTLFLAGHETTALALTWAWYLLATHPEAEARLLAEADVQLAGRPPAAEDAPRLRYAEWVALEAMRLYPPAYAVGREALAACDLGGWRLPAGMTVLMSQWVVQRDPRWFDRPDEFRPERWAGDAAQRLPKYAYFPFGGGPRLCIGNTFAMLEMVLVLAAIAQRCRFTLAPGQKVEPQPSFTLRPRGSILAGVTPRPAPTPAGPSPAAVAAGPAAAG